MTSNSCEVPTSNIVCRNDQHREKVPKVNCNLKKLCQQNNLFLIDHRNSITRRSLNGSTIEIA